MDRLIYDRIQNDNRRNQSKGLSITAHVTRRLTTTVSGAVYHTWTWDEE